MNKRALISVFDKTGLVELGKELKALGYELLSTGGTAKALTDAGLPVTKVSDITGFPEMLDGRVKTLHPKIHGGLLAVRDNEKHMEELSLQGISPIDIVVINLYPFRATIEKAGVTLDEAIENIDIGGPAMLRSSAKNFKDVTVMVDPMDYDSVLKELKTNGNTSFETRMKLALKVFRHTSSYDCLIQKYLGDYLGEGKFPKNLTLTFEKVQDMRYGENPHQDAAFYREIGSQRVSLANAKQLHGKELSFNNINDTNGALELLLEFSEPTVVAVKHANPCGVGTADNIFDAYIKAYECDPLSIFGGIVAANRPIDIKTAEEINNIFVEIVLAPSFEGDALEILKNKKNIRLLELPLEEKVKGSDMDIKKVLGGLLWQERDHISFDKDQLKVVTKREPNDKEWQDMIMAWNVVKHTKSNAIVLVKDKMTVGIGPGQVSRIWAAENAFKLAGSKSQGSALASDAFFPFSDVIKGAAKAGVTAIIQPGGSVKDEESIKEADENNITMVFTGIRHFKH